MEDGGHCKGRNEFKMSRFAAWVTGQRTSTRTNKFGTEDDAFSLR